MIVSKKNSIFEHYCSILDQLLKQDYFRFYFQSPFTMEDNPDACYIPKVKFYFGMTRGCLIDETQDYVVKFNLAGLDNNYCEEENRIYELAKGCLLEPYLTEMCYLGTYTKVIKTYEASDVFSEAPYNDLSEKEFEEIIEDFSKKHISRKEIVIRIPLWGYARANKIKRTSEYSLDLIKKVRQSGSPLSENYSAIGAIFVEHYGFDEFIRFSDFLMDNAIRDIHFGNIGLIQDRIVLIDYAGYKEYQ